MAFFNEFKERVNRAAQTVSSKTKESVEASRLTGEGRSIKSELEGLYAQIGLCYVDSKGDASEPLAALCARVAELRARLEELEQQKLLLKNQNLCPNCGSVMPKDARFCSNCGEKMPEPPADPEPEPEVTEVSEEVEPPEADDVEEPTHTEDAE